MPDYTDVSSLPDLDGAPPDFHAWAAAKTSSAAALRATLGATRWPEDLNKPPPQWLIPGFLQKQALHVVSAPKAARKTWLGLYTMLCGIYASPWLDGTPSTPFESIYIAADSPRWDIRSQVRKLLLGAGQNPPSLSEAGSFLLPFGFKFTNQVHVRMLAEAVAAWDIKALFIDVLLYTYDGLNENDNSDMGALFQVIKYFRDNLGLAVVVLHHHAKDPSIGARGAGTILQAAEHHYELRRKGDHTLVHREKLRGDEAETWTDLIFSLERIGDGRTLRRVLPATDSTTPATLSLLAVLESRPHTRAELVALGEAVGRSARWTDGELADLRARQLATSTAGVWSACRS